MTEQCSVYGRTDGVLGPLVGAAPSPLARIWDRELWKPGRGDLRKFCQMEDVSSLSGVAVPLQKPSEMLEVVQHCPQARLAVIPKFSRNTVHTLKVNTGSPFFIGE